MAFSSGFSPHPRISYANAAPTGTASEAEYVEIAVVERVDPERLREDLDAALPEGLDVVEVVEARTSDFADRLQASRWRLELPGVPVDELRASCDAMWAADAVEVERRTKAGLRTINVREALLDLQVADLQVPDLHVLDLQGERAGGEETGTPRPAGDRDGGSGCAILRVVVRQVTPTVRPDDILTALRSVAGLSPAVPPQVTREAQGPLGADGVTIGDPFEQDRENRAEGNVLAPDTSP